jgi:prepilin-type N-terminal cleavage/methylation domain-containing protein
MKKNMKKGITLIEIILAIVLIAIILGITIPKLMSNSDRAEIKSVISSDIRTIVEATSLWKRESSNANNSYANLDSDQIRTRLPSNMYVDPVSGYIHSGGLRTGTAAPGDAAEQDTGAQYIVVSDIDGAAIENGNISIIIDLSRGAAELGWEDRTLDYANEVVRDTMLELVGGDTTKLTRYDTGSYTTVGSTPETVDCTDTNIHCYDNINLQ